MERAIEMFVGVQLAIVGASHLLRPREWVDFIVRLRSLGHAGVFWNGLFPMVFSSLIVSFHSVWSGPPMVLTLMGWAMLVKSAICLCLPAVSLKSLERVTLDRAWEIQIAGGVALALGLFSLYLAFDGP